jgi:hypothetical protein
MATMTVMAPMSSVAFAAGRVAPVYGLAPRRRALLVVRAQTEVSIIIS